MTRVYTGGAQIPCFGRFFKVSVIGDFAVGPNGPVWAPMDPIGPWGLIGPMGPWGPMDHGALLAHGDLWSYGALGPMGP